jgi:hypothetical protein
MAKLMIWIKKYMVLAFAGSLAVFLGGLSTWLIAHAYQPDLPIQEPLRHFSTSKPVIGYPVTRYQSLFGGSLFFGEDVKQPLSVFQSKLVLWGLIHNGYAVVGDDPGSNQNTWIVKAGDTVAGEKIVSVGVRYIIVQNQSGEGKVEMRE